ncbi:MAG: hypothetical protein GF388_06475 [Candidatus Aegiribacteria sp.]|nr:hypothetical protein [Candidatus Aegiribacteria sp.]
MKIKLDTLEKSAAAVNSYGDKVTKLLNLGSHLREQPFAVIDRKMLGASGEVFTTDRYIEFKSNKGFSKLKKQETVNYSDVTKFEPSNRSNYLNWDFSTSDDKFTIGLIFYGKVKGIAPRNILWYDKEGFPVRSVAFYELLSNVVPKTGLTGELKTAPLKNTLQDAIAFFQGTRSAEDIGLKLNPGIAQYAEFYALQVAFSKFLAGTTLATESTTDAYLDIYRSLDNIYITILQKLKEEYNSSLGNIFSREQKIYEADEKFQRLSSIWYLRQMAYLHFASRHLSENEDNVWPLAILKPRARRFSRNNRDTVVIKLPDQEEYDEAIAAVKDYQSS